MTETTTMQTQLPEKISTASIDDMMKLTGQAADMPTQSKGLARLSINHASEDEEGNALPRGHFSLTTDDGIFYGEKATIRPFMRTYSYSVWDNEEGQFSSMTVQAPSFNSEFYDTEGGLKCGRLDANELESLPKDSPEWVLQKSVKCNQNIYGVVTLEDAKDKKGKAVEKKEIPCVWYAKGANFVPTSDCLKSLHKQKQPMWLTTIGLSSVRKKKGGNIYFQAELTPRGQIADWTEGDDKLMHEFMETVKGYNESIMKKHEEARGDKENFDTVVNE